jgi:hypothetical protein
LPASCGSIRHLILRHWVKVEAHDLYTSVWSFFAGRLYLHQPETGDRPGACAALRADESLAATVPRRISSEVSSRTPGRNFSNRSRRQGTFGQSGSARLYGYETPADLIHAVTSIGTQIYVDPHRREAFLKEMQNTGKVADFESKFAGAI